MVLLEFNKNALPNLKDVISLDESYTNNGSVDQSITYTGSYTNYDEQTWSNTKVAEQTYSITISAEIPVAWAEISAEIGGEVTAEWKYSQQTTNSSTHHETAEQTYTYPVVVPAKTLTVTHLSVFKGDCEITYTGSATITLENTKKFTYYTSGTYTGKSSSDLIATLTSTPIDSSGKPTGATIVKSAFAR